MRFPMLLAVVLVTGCLPRGSGGDGGVDPRDVRGNYALTYDNALLLQLNIGGAVREVTTNGYGGIADFGTYQGQPVQLDLAQFCARPEVLCPSEAYWSKVSIDMPDLEKNRLLLQGLQVIDDENPHLDAGQHAAVVGGLVNHADDDRFLVGLGAQGGSANSCGAIDVSFASGRFSRVGESTRQVTVYRMPNGAACDPDAGTPDAGASDGGAVDAGTCGPVLVNQLVIPDGARADGIKEGRVGFAWAGGCAFGPFLVGATLYLQTGYTGTRTGDFDPPPYVPAAPVAVDGGFPDGGTVCDGGACDGGP
jgi:hypothetical protein